jgi:hypothetical protein
MNRTSFAVVAPLLCLGALAGHPVSGAAQVISVKTSALAEGDQFVFFPTTNAAMGGVSIAIGDTLFDAFSNPARGGHVRRSTLFSTPTFASVSRKAGGGETFPFGAFLRSGRSFGGLVIATQHLDGSRVELLPPPAILAASGTAPTSRADVASIEAEPATLGDPSHSNRYAALVAGHTFAASGISIGASARWSRVRAIDGAELLYTGTDALRQSGRLADFRLGALKEWRDGQSVEAVVVRNTVALENDARVFDQFWDPNLRQMVASPRIAHDADRTRTWGMHLQYGRPLADSSWRIGGIVTANRITNPSFPADPVLDVPRDRGRSTAFDVGVGVAKTHKGSTFGIDAIWEPIASRAWVVDSTGTGAGAGSATTFENRFRFSNAIVRTGVGQEIRIEPDGLVARLQFGLQMRSIGYRLDQHDLAGTTSGFEDAWIEWTRTWGLTLRFSALDLYYRGRLTDGVGRPGLPPGGGIPPIAVDVAPRPGFGGVPQPTRMTLTDVRVTSHQIGFSLPIR